MSNECPAQIQSSNSSLEFKEQHRRIVALIPESEGNITGVLASIVC